MKSMKRQKERTMKDDFPTSVMAQYATGDQSQSKNNTQLWAGLVMEARSNAVRTILNRNLECEIHESRQIGSGQMGDGKSEH